MGRNCTNSPSWPLGERIARCEARWSLRVLPPFPDLSLSYVAPAVRADGSEAILKLGTLAAEFTNEVEALRLCDGRGMARLLEADAEAGAMLIERLRPGHALATVADDGAAMRVAADVMESLWRPLPDGHAFPSVGQWAAGMADLRSRFAGATGPFPAALVGRAEGLFADLLSSMATPVLLHGDLHQENILAAHRCPWLAIDPKGVAGEPAYEVGTLLRNPPMWMANVPDPVRRLRRRIDCLTDRLALDRERVVGWGVAQAVLAAWWSYEDEDRGWEHWLRCAQLIGAAA